MSEDEDEVGSVVAGEVPKPDRLAISPVLSNGTTLSDAEADGTEVAGVLVADGRGTEGDGLAELEQLVILTTVAKEINNATVNRVFMGNSLSFWIKTVSAYLVLRNKR